MGIPICRKDKEENNRCSFVAYKKVLFYRAFGYFKLKSMFLPLILFD